jgi:predicted porin
VVYLDTRNLGSTYGFNAAVPFPGVEALSLNAGYYSDSEATNGTGVKGTLTSIGGQYALSKRTNVFANYHTTSGEYKTFVGLSDGNAVSAAAKSAFTVGLGHSF